MQKPTLRLNLEHWETANKAAGRDSLRSRAEHIGMDHTLVSRIEKGVVRPGNQFIASVKLAYPRRILDYFFTAANEEVES